MVAKGENGDGSKWTVDIDEMLRVNWMAGESSRRCARFIFDNFGVQFTKSAIIGRADRKEYQRPPKRRQDYPKDRKKPAKVRRVRSAGWRPYIALATALPPTRDADGAGLTLFELGPHDCRYAISPDDATSHLFCGQPGFPYCLHHARLCYRATPRMTQNPKGVPPGTSSTANTSRTDAAAPEPQVPPPPTSDLAHNKTRSEQGGSSV